MARNKENLANKALFSPGSVYVKKWMRTKHAIMFRLSNKIVQVNFQDHTEILLNSENRFVTYVNKKGERSTMPLN
jgi:polo-like kinase 1